MSEKFYSEDGTDKWLAESGLLPEIGTYCDAGCAHPFKYSMTAFLRARGWKGVAIDGHAAYSPEWAHIPNVHFVHAVLSDKAWEHFLDEPTNALVSRVHEQGKGVPAFKLDQVLKACDVDRVDLLALDLEGMEVPVLREYLMGRSLARVPKIIVVEYNSAHKGRDVELFNYFGRTIYKLTHMTDCNAVFTIDESRLIY